MIEENGEPTGASQNEDIEAAAIQENDGLEASSGSPRRKFFVATGILVVLTLLVLGYWFWPKKTAVPETAETKEEVVVSVKVAKAETDSISRESTAVGTIVPAEQSTVSASISAQIREMKLLKNSVVK